MSRSKPRKFSALDLVEGMHLGHAAAALHDLGVLVQLAVVPSTAEELAAKFKLNCGMLRGLLNFLHARTDLLIRQGDFYGTAKNYDAHAEFMLGLYAGAYRENASEVQKILRRPSLASSLVDDVRHARAFGAASTEALGSVPEFIKKLEIDALIDIGCGPASLLLHLAAADAKFTGWGLEPNPWMCKLARARIRDKNLGKRIKLICCDSKRLFESFTPNMLAKVKAISACHVMNEMFGGGKQEAIHWMRQLRKKLPGKLLLVSDYYGRLGVDIATGIRETLLHDYAQLISGQGIPPANLDGWNEVYEKAGCRLIHAAEDRRSSQFIHVLLLG
ncbi:MAG: hypothetical protein KF712_05630 [Akkermansiaceae bacterium]|nr:hypothetical protein [Akkermansiaceae bacterium]